MASNYERILKKRNSEGKSFSSPSSVSNYDRVRFANIGDEEAEVRKKLNSVYDGWQSVEDMASYKKSVSDMYDKLSEYRNIGNGSADLDNLLGAYSDALNSWDDISNIYAQYGNADAYNIKKRESDWVNQNKGLSYDEVQRRLQTASGDEKNYLNRYGIIAGYNSIDDYDKDLANREKPNNLLKATDSTSSVTNKVLNMVGGNDTTYEELSTARNLYAADHAFDKYQTLENNADFAEKSQTFSTDKMNNGNGKVAYAPLLNKMTDEEKAVANYISNTNPSQLETYLRDIQMMVERRSYEETQGKLNKVADNPLGAIGLTTASYATNLLSEPFMMLEEMSGLAGLPYSPYSGAAELNTLSQGVRSHVSENIAEHGVLGKIGSFGYNVANSTIDSALGAYVLGKIGMGVTGTPAGAELFSKSLSILMGSGAFNSAYKDGIERGLSEDQAMIIGFANGLNEAIFEEISLDRLVKEKDLDSLGKAIKNVFTQAGVEGSEEVATDIANMLSEQVILGKQSEISEQKRQLMAYGYSEQEADLQILKEKSLQTLESFLAGAASGGLSTLGYSAINRSGYSANKKIGETIRNNQRIDDLSEFADKATTTNSNSIQYGAKEYKDSLSTKYEGDLSKATDGELGVLYKKARNDAYEAYAVQKQNDLRASAEEMLIAKGETEAKAKEMADSIAKDLVGEKLDSDDKNVLKIDIVKEVRDDIKENGTKEDSELLTESIADMKGLSEYAFRKEGTIKDAEIIDRDKVKITNADGTVETVKMSKLDGRTRSLVNIADDYSGRVREMFLSNYNGQNLEAYLDAFDYVANAYEKGMDVGEQLDKLSRIIPAEQIKEIYKETIRMGVAETERKLSNLTQHNEKWKGQFSGGTFKSDVAREKLTSREKMLYDIAKAFSDLGINIHIYKDSTKTQDGFFRRGENTVYLNLAAKQRGYNDADVAHTVMAMSHEFTHWMKHQDVLAGNRENGNYAMLEKLVKDYLGDRWYEDIESEKDKHRNKHGDDKNFREMNDEDAADEVVARACENMLNDTETMAKVLKNADDTTIGRLRNAIKEFFDTIHNLLSEIRGIVSSQHDIANYISKIDGATEKLREAWINGFESALAYNQHFETTLDNAGLMTDGNYVYATEEFVDEKTFTEANTEVSKTETEMTDAEFAEALGMTEEMFKVFSSLADLGKGTLESAQTFENSDYAKATEKVAQEISAKLGVSIESARQYIHDVGGVAKYIRQHSALLDYTSVEGKSAWVSNPEYGGSLDYSFLCPKRLTYTGTMNAIRDALDRKKKDIPFSVTDFLFLRASLKANGYESPCSFCFVESARMRFDKYNKKFIKNAIKDGLSYIPTFSELNNPDKLEKMRYEHKETYDAYIKYMNTLSQRKPKMLEERRAYDGDILKAFSDKSATKDGKTIEYKNLRGGIRFNSFSDFEVVHMIDAMQAILDMSRIGLAGFGYTKQKGFAEVFGNTGLKINLSCVAKGVSADGMHIVFDDYEGMNSKDAITLRNKFSKNVGVCCVVFTDEQLKAALCDERIDYVLPFHRSQWSSADYAKLGLPEKTKDFTKAQTEKGEDGKRLKEGNTPFLSYWDFNKSGKENVQNYLDKVINNDTENAVKPLFADVLTQNADGTWSMYKAKDSSKEERIKEKASDNYWKLLTEFKLYDNEGNPSPQNPVRPTFEMKAANNLLKTYDGSHTAFPVADNVVDEFLKYKEDGVIPDNEEFEGFKSTKTEEFTVMYVKDGETQIDKKTGKLKLTPKKIKADNVETAMDIAMDKYGLDVDIDATRERQEYDDLNSEQEEIDDWLDSLSIEDLLDSLISKNLSSESKTKKERAKSRVDEVNKRLKKIGLTFNGTSVAGWTDENISRNLNRYAASNDKYAQAYIAYMKPIDFLNLTMGGNTATVDRIENESSEYGDLDLKQMGSENIPIFLDIDEGRSTVTTGHEGRHRMMLLGKAGFEKVPVLLFNYDNKYSKETRTNVTLKPQNFGNGFVSPTRSVIIDEMIPFSNGNKDLITEKFGKGNADADVLYSEQEDRDALDIASEYVDIASEYDDYGTLDATDYAIDEMISPIAYNIVDGKISEYIDGLRVVIDDEEADESLKARAEKLIKRLKGFGSTLYSEQEIKNPATYNGQKFWSGSVSLLDGFIEEVHTYEEAENAGFHHSLYFSDEQVEKLDSDDNAFFYINDNGEVEIWRDDIPDWVKASIKKQISKGNDGTLYSEQEDLSEYAPIVYNNLNDMVPITKVESRVAGIIRGEKVPYSVEEYPIFTSDNIMVFAGGEFGSVVANRIVSFEFEDGTPLDATGCAILQDNIYKIEIFFRMLGERDENLYTEYVESVAHYYSSFYGEKIYIKTYDRQHHEEFRRITGEEKGKGRRGNSKTTRNGLQRDGVLSRREIDADIYRKLNPKLIDDVIALARWHEIGIKPGTRFYDNVTPNLIDSNGDYLTKSTQKYFEKSKVRDKEGRLLVLYHGTWEEFDEFKPNEYLTEKNGLSRIVGYFSEDEEYSKSYGKTSAYYLDIRNPLVLDEQAKTLDGWKKFFESKGIKDVVFDSSVTGENGTKDTLKGANYEDGTYYTYYEILDSSNYWSGDGNVTEMIQKAGYDGIQTNDEFEKAWMPFNANQIKSVKNTNPTSDDRYMYSEQEDETYNDYRKASNEVNKQYSKLTNDVRRLEAMLKLDKTKTLDPAQLRRTAQELIEETESDLSVNEVISALKETYDYILQLPNHRDDARFERTIEMAKKAAKKILTEQSNKNIDAFSKEVLQHIRKSRVKFDDAQKAEAINQYGGNYRNAFMGKIVIVKDGIELDSWWQDMAENYPGLFKSDVNSADMPTELINIVDKLKSVKVDGEVREVSDDDIQYVAERIYAKFWDGFVSRSDLYDARLKQIMDEHEAQIDAIKKSQSQYLESKINYYREQQMMSNKDYIANKVAEEKARMQDAALRKATIDKITKNAVDLANWIKSPNTKSGNYNRVPEALRGPVSEVIKAIDFSSKQMLGMTSRTLHAGTPTQKDISIAQALSHLYDVMADANTDKVDLNTYLDLPPMFISELKALVTQVNDIQRKIGKDNAYVLNQMTSEQLQNLLNTVKTVRKAVTDFNKLLANANGHSVDSVAYKTIEYAKRLGQRKWSDGLFKDFFAYDQALPYYAFKRFGEGGQEMFTELQDGWDKFAYNARDIKNFVEKTYKPKEVRDWNNEVHTFTILEPKEDGTGSQERELKLTTAQIMSLYCLSKREQAKGHLLGGGIVPTDITTHDGKFNTTQKISQPNAVRITDESLNKILETLTDRQMEVADALQKFMAKECADWGNEITMKRFGILGFTEENYFPIKSDSNIIGGGMRENEKSIYALLNMSFTKALTQGANNQIMIDDIFQVFTVHASDMAKYNALALPVLDMIKWWNYKEKDRNGRVDNSTRVALESAFGKASNKYINNFLSDLNGNMESHRGDKLQRKMLSRYKRAAVAANLQVALLQPLSYIRAYNAMDRRYLNKALRNVFDWKNGYAESKEHSGLTIWKDFGFFNTDISRGLDSLFRQDGTWVEKAVDKSMWFAGHMDSVTWGIIWNSCKYEVEATTKLEKGSDDYYKAINDKMRDLVYRTQVIDSTMTRTDVMRSTNPLAQLDSAFASEPSISYNVVMDKVSDLVMDTKLVGKGEAFKRHGKGLAKAMNIYLISACVESALRLAISHYRGNAPDDEEVWKDYAQRVLEELNPLTKIPYIKGLWEVAENTLNRRQSARMDEQFVVSTIQAFQSVAKATDEGWTYKTTYNTLRAVSQLSGLPLGSTLTEMVSLWNLIFGNMFPDLKITK